MRWYYRKIRWVNATEDTCAPLLWKPVGHVTLRQPLVATSLLHESFAAPHSSKKPMKAIQISRTGGPEVMELVDLPVPQPKPNEAIVQVKAAGINFIDIYNREGRYKAPLPLVLGQEAAGVVIALGTDAKAEGMNASEHSEVPAVGDRVAYTSVLGAYAEYAAVPIDRLVKVPEGVGDREAAAVMLQGITAHYLAYDTHPLRKGETALIHAAAGGVGLILVQMAHNIGARVIATVSTEEKAKLARAAGADEIILYTQSDFEVETKRLTGGKGVDVVYDSVGKTTFEKGLNVLRPRSMMVLFGGSSGAVAPIDPLVLTQKGSLFLTRPSLTNYIATSQELHSRAAAVFAMIRDGKLKLRIEHVYPLAEAQKAHRDLEARKTTGKLLLLP
jgi:NADPH2:quinone reductase